MSISERVMNRSGFTLVEALISMGIGAIVMFALSTGGFFFSRAFQTAKIGAHRTDLRSLVFMNLSKRGSPKDCKDILRGPSTTQAGVGSALTVSTLPSWTSSAFGSSSGVPVGIHEVYEIPTSKKIINLVSNGLKYYGDGLEYEVHLFGDEIAQIKKSEDRKGDTKVYSAVIELRGRRLNPNTANPNSPNPFTLGAPLTQELIPLVVELHTNGQGIYSCSVRPEIERIQGLRSTADCLTAGGRPMPVDVSGISVGAVQAASMVCVFNTDSTSLVSLQPPCLPADLWAQTPAGCVSKPYVLSPPDCPTGFTQVPGSDKRYCMSTTATVCPDAAALGASYGYLNYAPTTPVTGTLYCRYEITTCPTVPGASVVTMTDPTDGITPTCVYTASACPPPFTDNPGSSPLTCNAPVVPTATATLPTCPNEPGKPLIGVWTPVTSGPGSEWTDTAKKSIACR
jgi:hypothetical protein